MRITHVEYEPIDPTSLAIYAQITAKRLFRKPVKIRLVKMGYSPWIYLDTSDLEEFGYRLLKKIPKAERQAARNRMKKILEK